MNVLGLFGFGMNPGACLLRDGRLVSFAEEERFARIKAAPDLFPGRAVKFCLKDAGLELGDVDQIGFAWDARKYPYQMLGTLARQYLKYRGRARRTRLAAGGDATLFAAFLNVLKYSPSRLREEIRLGLRAQGLHGEVPPIEFVPHHLCHSYSAYFCSPFREALVLTIDGSGEEVCTQIAVGRGERLMVEESIPIPHSLGWYYAAFTAYLGFEPYRDEGKLMALAGLGAGRERDNPWIERLSKVLRVDGGSYEVDPTYTRFGGHYYAERFTDALADFITGFDPGLPPLAPAAEACSPSSPRSNGSPPSRCLEPGYVDLAWGVQAKLEEAVRAVAVSAAKRHGLRHLCIAGGVGLNCKLNGTLLSNGPFEGLFVQPASYDAGAAIGAAMVVAEAGGDAIRNPLEHAYWGPGWSNARIKAVLDACKIRAEECPDIAARVACELAEGKLVAWFQGRMELGPRALGARSILADPRQCGVKDRLNLEVKSREPWRPFGPSLLEEASGEWLEGACESPFMTLAFRVKDGRREAMDSAMHVDGTARPQTVTASANPRFHRLLTEFRGATGLPFVINTSFNGRNEPLVCSPLEAVRSFYSTGLDALAMGDFLLSKT